LNSIHRQASERSLDRVGDCSTTAHGTVTAANLVHTGTVQVFDAKFDTDAT
jgi:hypothetical protein